MQLDDPFTTPVQQKRSHKHSPPPLLVPAPRQSRSKQRPPKSSLALQTIQAGFPSPRLFVDIELVEGTQDIMSHDTSRPDNDWVAEMDGFQLATSHDPFARPEPAIE